MRYDMQRFHGVSVALNAAYKNNGELDTSALKRVCRWYVEKGVQGLYLCGSTGEGLLLSEAERKTVMEAVSEECGKELSLIVHVGANSTAESVRLAAHAEENGAHAISSLPCIYYNVGEEGIAQHWNTITDAANLPFIIYNIPSTTSYALSRDMLQRMLQNDKVCGLKNSSLQVYDITMFRALAPKDFVIFNGPDEHFAAGLLMGANAGIGGTYGIMPELYVALYRLVKADALCEAFDLQKRVTWLILDKLLAYPSLYGLAKNIIRLRSGIDLGPVRAPLRPVPPESPGIAALAAEIDSLVEYAASLLEKAGA